MPALADNDKPALLAQDLITAIQRTHKGQKHLPSTHKISLQHLATIFEKLNKSPRVEKNIQPPRVDNINTPTDSNNITIKSNIKYKHLIHQRITCRNTPIPNTPNSLIKEYMPKHWHHQKNIR